MKRIPFPVAAVPRAHRGVALIVSMILLVIITLLGLSSMRNTGLQERMTANLVDRGIQFQAAETAEREAEAKLPPTVAAPVFSPVCAAGLCTTPDPSVTPRWQDPAFANWADAATDLGVLAAGAPQYIVEDMGTAEIRFGCSQEVPPDPLCNTSPRYRITSRSDRAGGDRNLTVIQSSYKP